MSCRIYEGPEPVQPIVWPSTDNSFQVRQQAPEPARRRDTRDSDQMAELAAAAEVKVREARAAGFEAGKQAAAAEIGPVLERLAQAVAELATVRARLRKQAEADLVKLALGIARRILRRELTVDPHALRGVVTAALAQIQARESCTVRIHPDHESTLRRNLEQSGASGVSIAPDVGMQRGDLLVETSRGTLDASIDTQLSEIERGLVDRLGQ